MQNSRNSFLCFQIMFEVVQVVDNGRTQVGRAGRINPKYENQGFIKYFGASMNEWRRKNNIKRISFVINDANPALRKATFQQRYRRAVSTKVSLIIQSSFKVKEDLAFQHPKRCIIKRSEIKFIGFILKMTYFTHLYIFEKHLLILTVNYRVKSPN